MDRRHSSSERTCWHCGSTERHSRKQCPASKPGVACYHCLGRNHFAVVRRSLKDFFKKANQGRRQSRFTHWIMQCCQRTRTVVMTFITSPWMSQSTLCHQLLLSCSPRSPFRCLAILSWTSSVKSTRIQLPPAPPYIIPPLQGDWQGCEFATNICKADVLV